MENLQPAIETTSPPRRRPLFLVGLLLLVVGPAVYFVQVVLKHLWTPWYVPLLASLGMVFMIASVWQRRGAWRCIGLILCALLCGGEWYLMLVAIKSPDYTGPVRLGVKLPEFAATLADGRSFTSKDVEDEGRSVLIFFRGRW